MFRNAVKLMLHRPLLDLEPDPGAEFFANAAARSADALDTDEPPYPVWVQRRGSPGLRDALLRECGAAAPAAPRWHAVQAACARWPKLDTGTKIKLARVLLQVGHVEPLQRLLAADPARAADARLDLLAVSVDVSLQRAGHRQPFDPAAALARCEAAARRLAPEGRSVATLRAFLLALQYLNDPELTAACHRRLMALVDEWQRQGGGFLPRLLQSCLLRAAAMWPQAQGDVEAMSECMRQAEALALALPADTPLHAFLAEENLFSLYESRTRECLVRRDLEGALHFARTLVARFPFTSTARIEMAEVLLRLGRADEAAVHYELAAEHAPPGAAVAWFMAGEAHAAAGRPAAALTAWLASQRHDGLARSAVRRAAERGAAEPALSAWCRQWFTTHAPQEIAA